MATAKKAPAKKAAKHPSGKLKQDRARVESQASFAERFEADKLRIKQSVVDMAANAAAPSKASKTK